MSDELFDELALVIAETLGIDRARVTPELSAEAVDQWDSLNHLRLITAVESQFAIRMTMEEVISMASVGDLAAVVGRHRGKQ